MDHNLIFYYSVFACRGLINSGVMVIFLAIMKSFADDRNRFIIEESRNLNFTVNAGFDLVDDNEEKLQIISQHNEQEETDSLSMTTGIIPEKSPDNETILIPTPINTHFTSPNECARGATQKSSFSSSSYSSRE